MEKTLNTTSFDVDFGIIVESGTHVDYYEGSYEITPTQSEQSIPIAHLTAKQDIKVNPIPSNYGKVSQIGNELVIE